MVHAFRLLFTGFRPFGGAASNPSGDAARELARIGRVEVAGPFGTLLTANITARVFDVLWTLPADGSRPQQSGAADEAERAIDEIEPDIVIATGMAGPSFRAERQAEDRDDPHEDNAGRRAPAGRREFPSEPLHLPTTLPCQRIEAAWASAGITNVEISRSAGNFICEDVFYRVMRAAQDPVRRARGMRIHRAGFIHVPSSGYTTTAQVVLAMEVAIREVMLDIPWHVYLPAIDSPVPVRPRPGLGERRTERA